MRVWEEDNFVWYSLSTPYVEFFAHCQPACFQLCMISIGNMQGEMYAGNFATTMIE